MGLLDELAQKNYGAAAAHTKKDKHYLSAYDELLINRRGHRLSVLELGVSTGASLAIWAEYLPASRIVGIDLLDRPALVPDDPRIGFVQGSQDDPAALDQAIEFLGGKIDLVIDDASHLGAETRSSFEYLFPRLAPGGTYVIEDCGASFIPYFSDHGPYPPQQTDPRRFQGHDYGILGVTKQIIDEMFLAYSGRAGHMLGIQEMRILPHIAFITKSRL